MSKITLQVRTRDNLLDLLANGQSEGWIVAPQKEQEIENVEIVNFEGTQMIRAKFDSSASHRLPGDSCRLVIHFKDASIMNCQVSFDSQNPVRYVY